MSIRGAERGYMSRYTLFCCTVITENFFQDNKEDVEFLLVSEGRQAVVQIHNRWDCIVFERR